MVFLIETLSNDGEAVNVCVTAFCTMPLTANPKNNKFQDRFIHFLNFWETYREVKIER